LIVSALALVASGYIPVTAAHAQVLSLKEEAEKSGILIGSGAIRPDLLDDPEFARVLAQQFRSLSPDNELKFSRIEPQPGVFDFAPIDKLVAFAQQHDMVVKGHGLISGGFNPGWLTGSSNTPEFVRAATFNHFDAIMDRYAGKMDRWDVATEVLSTFGTTGVDPITGQIADARGLVQNFWWNKLGPDYLAEVFQMAHDADPSAKLFLNESLVEYYPEKAQRLYDLVADLVARGVPIHGVGLEMHATIVGPPPGAITAIVNAYHALGLEVAITEMDVHVTDDFVGPGQSDAVQAQIYGDVIAEALAAGVTEISFWGFSDVYIFTWLPGARPHIYDENYDPKPAYFTTWTALADHSFVSAQDSLESVGDDVQALVDAGTLDARKARRLASELKFAVKQLDLADSTVAGLESAIRAVQRRIDSGHLSPEVGQRLIDGLEELKLELDERLTASAVARIESAISLVQGLVDSGHLPPEDGQGLIYELTWVLSKLD
jgi:endo-1,4-beta-xylanase